MSRLSRSCAVGAAVAALLLGSFAVPPTASAAPAIPDAALRSCVTDKLGLGRDAEPTAAQLATVTDLSCTGKGVASLEGIGHLTGLTKLFVGDNAITDLTPLASSTQVFSLGAANNRIADVGPLASLTKLRSLNVAGNALSDLSALRDLPIPSASLTAHGQKVVGAPAVAGTAAPKPALVDAKGTGFTPAEAPQGATVTGATVVYAEPGSYAWTFHDASRYFNGTVTVTVAPSSIDIPDAGLRGCVTKALGVATDAPVKPADLAALTELSCVGAGVTSLVGLEHATGLSTLTLSSNKITDLAPLSGLTGLTKLMLPSNPVEDAAPLSGLTRLTVLSLDNGAVTSLQPLAGLTALTDLSVTQRSRSPYPGISSLAGVEKLTNLTRLVANNSQVTDLTPVQGLTRLTSLHLLGNQVADLTPLAGLTGLTNLGLANNQIVSVAPLAGLTKLQQVDLATNRIHDLSPLGSLPQLGYMGLKARWQKATLPAVPAEFEVAVPAPRPRTGGPAVSVTAPAGVTVVGDRVTYPAPGTYEWAFADTANEFGGTVTQVVTEKVADPASIPDAGLRSCIALAAGLTEDATPTVADVARVTRLDCAGRGIADLTGLDLATAVTALDLSGNPVATGLDTLASLPALATLDLSRTGLTDVGALTGLRASVALRIDGNALTDLSGLAPTGVVARDQAVRLPAVTGDEPPAAVTVTTADGRVVRATPPSGVVLEGDTVRYPVAGDYAWTFAVGDFTGTIVQPVTRDRVPTDPHAGAPACLAAGNVWVVVERDTGQQKGGCATRFGTGLEALISAGFPVQGEGFITAIDGYPTGPAGEMYWSYWQSVAPKGGGAGRWTYSQLGASQSRPRAGSVEGWRFVSWANNAEAVPPTWTPTFAGPTPTKTPTPTASPTPSATASPTPTKPTAPVVDVYGQPGFHVSGGRHWYTSCEPYSQTVRCRTDVWATEVRLVDGRWVSRTGWVFNNLTYQPLMTRAQWAGNPLATTGEFVSAGRRWRTECDTAVTGRGGCRSYVWSTTRVVSAKGADGTWRHRTEPGWVFNNLVRFR